MKILHVTTHESSGGASIAAMRLHKALLTQGMDSHVAVLDKEGAAPNVIHLGGKISRRVLRPLILQFEETILNGIHSRPQQPGYTTFSITPSWNHARLNRLPKDILHLHWVGEGFLTPFSLERLRGPVVWTMHDAFPFTGGCHFPSMGCTRYREGCGQCPEIGSTRGADISRLHWLWKRRAIKRRRPVIVSPSREYTGLALQSGMLGDCRVEIIPNGVDADVFRPIPKEQARALLGLPHDKKLLLFGAMLAVSDPRKGFDLLCDALQRLQAITAVEFSGVIFGAAVAVPALPCPVHFLGRLHDPVALALAYSAADVFVCPSRQESFSLTSLEAMACGTPVVAFPVGGIPDMVEHGINGMLATPYDPQELADGIAHILAEPVRRENMGRAAREKVERCYSMSIVVQKYITLYEEVLEKF